MPTPYKRYNIFIWFTLPPEFYFNVYGFFVLIGKIRKNINLTLLAKMMVTCSVPFRFRLLWCKLLAPFCPILRIVAWPTL